MKQIVLDCEEKAKSTSIEAAYNLFMERINQTRSKPLDQLNPIELR